MIGYNGRMEEETTILPGAESDSDEIQKIPEEWLEEFRAVAARSWETRFRHAFIRTYKPVLDDASYRSFDTMESYRRWCEENLPSWLGYGRV